MKMPSIAKSLMCGLGFMATAALNADAQRNELQGELGVEALTLPTYGTTYTYQTASSQLVFGGDTERNGIHPFIRSTYRFQRAPYKVSYKTPTSFYYAQGSYPVLKEWVNGVGLMGIYRMGGLSIRPHVYLSLPLVPGLSNTAAEGGVSTQLRVKKTDLFGHDNGEFRLSAKAATGIESAGKDAKNRTVWVRTAGIQLGLVYSF